MRDKAGADEVGQRLTRNARRRGILHVVAIDPRQLGDVEDRGAMSDLGHVEPARHVAQAHQFLALAGGPSEQRQVVDERLGEKSALPELRNARRAMTLRQRRVVGAQHER